MSAESGDLKAVDAIKSKQMLVLAISQFLRSELSVLPPDKAESIEIAVECLESTYEINTETRKEIKIKAPLLEIFESVHPYIEQVLPDIEVSDLDKEKAEELKNDGNLSMKNDNATEAVERYTKAIELNPYNHVYYCNRAAAYSKLEKHVDAIADCDKAIYIDPTYSKAYGRMGIAHSALEDHKTAKTFYQKALELDPDNDRYKNNLAIAENKLQDMDVGGATVPAGMPDLNTLMANPQIMQFAQNMMSDPNMHQMFANVMQSMESGGMDAAGLLQAGQQFAQQMEAQNPELVAQLKEKAQQELNKNNNQPGSEEKPPEA